MISYGQPLSHALFESVRDKKSGLNSYSWAQNGAKLDEDFVISAMHFWFVVWNSPDELTNLTRCCLTIIVTSKADEYVRAVDLCMSLAVHVVSRLPTRAPDVAVLRMVGLASGDWFT
jgi:hypothetical protein